MPSPASPSARVRDEVRDRLHPLDVAPLSPSRLWVLATASADGGPSTWRPDAVPLRAVIAGTVEQPDTPPEGLAADCGPAYGTRLYG